MRWRIANDKLPARLELRDYFHAFETEENRSEMLGYFMSVMHMLHISYIVSGQYNQAQMKRRRPEGVATMRDRPPKLEALPVAFVELLTLSNEKVNKPTPSMSLPESLTAEELRDRPMDLGQVDDDEDPWAALDENEYEGPSFGRAKANHPTPPPAAPAPAQQEPTPPQAAVEGEPLAENDLPGTVCPKNCRGHVEKYRYMLDVDINGKVVEHVTVDGRPFELITKTCWKMGGAESLRFCMITAPR